jgi:hypothetical protein
MHGSKAYSMTKDSSGVWSVKVGPVKPDMYPYCFVVDGISVADPRNTSIFPNEGFQNSLVDNRAYRCEYAPECSARNGFPIDIIRLCWE